MMMVHVLVIILLLLFGNAVSILHNIVADGRITE